MTTAQDIAAMIQHWLETPVNGYLGSDYGQDLPSLLHNPFSDGGADAFIQKMKQDIPILQALPAGSVNIYTRDSSPDNREILIEVAGQVITVRGYRQQNHMGVSVIDGAATGEGVSEGTVLKGGIMGDDSLDIASTKGLLVGGYYLLTDGVDTRMIRVEEILTENRIRLSPELDRNWEAGATLTGSTFTQRNGNTVLGGVSAKDGGQWISRSINLGTDNGDRAVVVRRTLSDAKARLFFIDSRNPSWVEIQWEHCRSNNLDIPDGFGDYEYIVPMRGDGALRLQVVGGDMDINHIAALGTPTGLGGASNPDNRPPAPAINFPADGATDISETPSFSITPVIGEWESIQFDVKDSLGESIFTDVPTQKGTQYSLPAGHLLAGEEYKWLARVALSRISRASRRGMVGYGPMVRSFSFPPSRYFHFHTFDPVIPTRI